MSAEETKTGSERRLPVSTEKTKAGSEETRDVDETRRALIQAGWIIPAVIALKLPTNAFAQASGGPAPAHNDSSTHQDTTVLGQPHVDVPLHVDA